jgi:hypothetical protein
MLSNTFNARSERLNTLFLAFWAVLIDDAAQRQEKREKQRQKLVTYGPRI